MFKIKFLDAENSAKLIEVHESNVIPNTGITIVAEDKRVFKVVDVVVSYSKKIVIVYCKIIKK